MKFMFFNLMAVIAILYLVAVDGKPMKSAPDFLSFISSKDAGDVKKKGTEMATRARKKLESFKAKWQKPATTKVPPKFEPVKVAVRPVNKVPPIGKNKPASKSVIKLAPKPVESAPQKKPKLELKQNPKQKFMSRAERRRELIRLAHDMEMMFADKLSD